MNEYDIAVIGGGASGMAAAICAADTAPKARVCVCEALPRVGKKLLATGNGRCNLMNETARAEAYFGESAFISPALELYKREYPAFWSLLGLRLSTEEAGRVYPAGNQAAAVLDVLRLALSERHVSELTECEVTKIAPDRGGFLLSTARGPLRARRVILATGGRAGKGLSENDSFEKLLRPLGHRFTPLFPALTWLTVPREHIAGLKGLRYRGSIALYEEDRLLSREEGEVLFQDEALSGIASMQLSLFAAGRRHLSAVMSLVPEDFDILARAERFAGRTAGELLTGAVNKQMALLALKRCLIPVTAPVSSLKKEALLRLQRELTAWRVPVTGTGDFRSAQVMLGGADTREFDENTLESKKVPGLYACGELLDVTGPCGGYNLEWAWACGMLAGRKAAESL